VTRVSRRGLVRALRALAPDPPPELGRKLKEQIPEDLFAARATPPSSKRRTLGRPPWALAASILVAIGSGYLAVRLFEDRGGAARQELAELDLPRFQSAVERDEGGLRSSAGTDPSRPAEPSVQDGPSGLPESSAGFDVARPAARLAAAESAPGVSAPREVGAPSAPAPRIEAVADVLGQASQGSEDTSPPVAVPGSASPAPVSPPATAARPIGAGADLHDLMLVGEERRAEVRSGESTTIQAESIREQNQPIREQGQSIRELEAEKRKLEQKMQALPGTTANLEASSGARDADPATGGDAAEWEASPPAGAPRVEWHAEQHRELQAKVDRLRSDRRSAAGADRSSLASDFADAGAGIEVATQPISSLTVITGRRSLEVAAGSALDGGLAVPLEEALDAAAAARAARSPSAIELEGTPSRTPGRIVLLLSAVVAASDLPGGAAGAASSIEVELDPAAARRYRLLASHVHVLPATPPAAAEAAATAPSAIAPSAGARSAAAPSTDAPSARRSAVATSSPAARMTTTPSYRLTALYEIELRPGSSPGATLGVVRLRSVDAVGDSAATVSRPIGAADLARGWNQAPVELRLAILAAELSAVPRDAEPAQLAPFAQEIERLRVDASLEPAAARLAAELAAAAAAVREPSGMDPVRPAAAPARNDR
jgi:hypothetical protein